MSISGIQGQLLEITVVECHKLKDTEWISRQDPYVCLEYGSTKFRTRTCTDGGKNPTFQEKFVFNLIEGLREINAVVWNSNTITHDAFIGSGKIQIQDVLSRGYDDRAWPLQTKTGRHAGEIKLIMHYGNANKAATNVKSSATSYVAPHQQHQPMYSAPPLAATTHSHPTLAFPPQTLTAYPPTSAYPPPHHQPYPTSSPYPYPPKPDRYPTPPHSYPPPAHSPYPPHTVYPPPSSVYPPPPHASPYSHSGYYAGEHPPPRY